MCTFPKEATQPPPTHIPSKLEMYFMLLFKEELIKIFLRNNNHVRLRVSQPPLFPGNALEKYCEHSCLYCFH